MTKPASTPLVSVIVVCYKSVSWLPRCLESLRAQTYFPRMEVIILDNASGDGSEELAGKLTADWPNACVIQTGRNYGFGIANNRGADRAQGEYLFLVNPDTWFEPDCVEQLCESAKREGAGGAGATMLEYGDDTLQARGSHGFDFCGNPVSPRGGRAPSPLFCIAGFYFVRRDLYQRLGRMDEEFFMYGEEMDLSWRIWIAGEKVIYVPAARVHHQGAVGVSPDLRSRQVENRTSEKKRFLANRNYLLVLAKNCQHVLLLMLIPCALLILLEGVATLVIARSWSLARTTCWDAIAGCWRLRGHVRQKRKEIRGFRRRGDFWMLRFLRFGFGRQHEIAAMLQRGFPKFNRS